MSTGFFRRHRHWWVVAIVVPVLLVGVGLGILNSFNDYNSALHGKTKGGCAGSNSNNFVYVMATITAVDTDTLTATMRLEFTPNGNLADQNQQDAGYLTLTGPMTMTTSGLLAEPPGSSSNGGASAGPPSYQSASSSYVYPAGDYMQDLDVSLPLSPGFAGPSPPGTSSEGYPWDTYVNESTFAFQFWHGIGTRGGNIASCVGLTSSVGGSWAVTANPLEENNAFNVSFARSQPVKLYCYFVMGLMWALALGGVAMAVIMMMRKQEEIDTAAFAYLAALLFAFPLIRQTLPGNPGLGSLVDLLSYFWTEVIVATTLVILLVRWITLKGRHESEEDEEQKKAEEEAAKPAF